MPHNNQNSKLILKQLLPSLSSSLPPSVAPVTSWKMSFGFFLLSLPFTFIYFPASCSLSFGFLMIRGQAGNRCKGSSIVVTMRYWAGGPEGPSGIVAACSPLKAVACASLHVAKKFHSRLPQSLP